MKKARKKAKELVKTSLVLGVGGSVVTQAGGSGAGIAAMSRFQPTFGTLAGATTALDMTKKLQKKKKRKRR